MKLTVSGIRDEYEGHISYNSFLKGRYDIQPDMELKIDISGLDPQYPHDDYLINRLVEKATQVYGQFTSQLIIASEKNIADVFLMAKKISDEIHEEKNMIQDEFKEYKRNLIDLQQYHDELFRDVELRYQAHKLDLFDISMRHDEVCGDTNDVADCDTDSELLDSVSLVPDYDQSIESKVADEIMRELVSAPPSTPEEWITPLYQRSMEEAMYEAGDDGYAYLGWSQETRENLKSRKINLGEKIKFLNDNTRITIK